MEIPKGREITALKNAALVEWEDRAHLGGPKTFASLLQNGWIEQYDKDGDKFAITQLGREALLLKSPRAPRRKPLRTLEPRLKTLKGPREK